MWLEYLKVDPTRYNCLSFIELVSGIDMRDIREFSDSVYGQNKSKWGTVVDLATIDTLAKNNGFIEVGNIVELLPKDIMLFVLREERPMHFGYYIGNNQFIHLRQKAKIDELQDIWRSKLKRIYRYVR